MGLLSGLFGGGSTKVNQTTTSTTEVDVGVDLENVINIDLGFLGESMEKMSEVLRAIFASNVEGQELKAEDQKLKAAEVLILLNGQQLKAKEETDRTSLIKKVVNTALAAAGIFLVYRLYKGAK